jgi:hypothetical protein
VPRQAASGGTGAAGGSVGRVVVGLDAVVGLAAGADLDVWSVTA